MYTWCKKMSIPLPLNEDIIKLIEQRMITTLEGIEDTLERVGESREITEVEMRENIESFEKIFHQLFQKWSLEIMYTLSLKNSLGFNEIKKALGVNSRTLSDKLKFLNESGYINRKVDPGPPLNVEYILTKKGRNTILLAIPLLYYVRSEIV